MLLPVAGLVSVYFLLRGHNAPGGGFVGGLAMATGIIVQYMTSGVLWVESRLRVHPQYWLGAGLLAAGVAGMAAWLVAAPFLTSIEWDAHVPLLGRVPSLDRAVVRYRRLYGGRRRDGAHADRDWAPVAASSPQKRCPTKAPRTLGRIATAQAGS